MDCIIIIIIIITDDETFVISRDSRGADVELNAQSFVTGDQRLVLAPRVIIDADR